MGSDNPEKEAGAEPDAPAYQCGICKQSYKRADHLARHVRSHYRHKPHRCHICAKSFSRTDLLKRHVAGHTRDNGIETDSVREVQGRVSRACKSCASNHLRCTESKPCKRCQNKGIECVAGDDLMELDQDEDSPSSQASIGKSPVMNAEPSGMNDSPAAGFPGILQQSTPMRRISDAPTYYTEVDHTQPPETMREPHLTSFSQPPLLTPQSQTFAEMSGQRPQFSHSSYNMDAQNMDQMRPHYDMGGEAMPSQLHGSDTINTIPSYSDWNFLPGCQPPAGGASNLNTWIPDQLDDLDMRFLDVYNHAVPFELGGGSQPEFNPGFGVHEPSVVAATSSPEARHLVASGSEAFRRHHWRFKPNDKDRLGAEEHNLSLPIQQNDQETPESRVSIQARVTSARLQGTTRDRILGLVIRNCRSDNLSRAIQCFPNIDLLDKLLQYYLTSPLTIAHTFIHIATFDPNAKRPELLLAIAAAGAVLTSDAALAKLGYAMQEIIRPAVGSVWESDNTLTRDTELMQAFLIHLEIGVWSGNSRKIEITESFLQAPLTMLRRAGKFKKSAYPDLSMPMSLLGNNPSLNGPALEKRWRAWVNDEMCKRTALRLLAHDTNSSMSLVVNPLLSYAEVTLPLPCAPGLWTSHNSDQWRCWLIAAQSQIDHQGMQPHPATIADLVDDPATYAAALGSGLLPFFDKTLANIAFVSFTWGLCWEYTQLANLCRDSKRNSRSFYKAPSRWNPHILSSRKDELLKLLHQFRIAAEPHNIKSHESQVLCSKLEHMLLHMHAPIEDIQIFAGMEGPEHGADVHDLVVDWAASEGARKAVWHSSQIVSAARKVAKGSLQGPFAFTLYHASLVLWTYTLVWLGEQQQRQRQGQGQESQIVYLDGEAETMATQRFFQMGTGRPCFRAKALASNSGERDQGIGPSTVEDEEEVFLEEPDKVMRALVSVFLSNHGRLPRPHLVDRMIQLMEALQRSPRLTGDRLSESTPSA